MIRETRTNDHLLPVRETRTGAVALIGSIEQKKARTIRSGFIIGINVFMDAVPVWDYSQVWFLFPADNDRNVSTTPV